MKVGLRKTRTRIVSITAVIAVVATGGAAAASSSISGGATNTSTTLAALQNNPDLQAVARDLTRLEQASVVKSLENLTKFPWVRGALERNELALHGAYFDVATGQLTTLDPASERFVALTTS